MPILSEHQEGIRMEVELSLVAKQIADRIGQRLFQAFEKCMSNRLDYIGSQLHDIKASMQIIAQSIREVAQK